jgi:hypothetical protein
LLEKEHLPQTQTHTKTTTQQTSNCSLTRALPRKHIGTSTHANNTYAHKSANEQLLAHTSIAAKTALFAPPMVAAAAVTVAATSALAS